LASGRLLIVGHPGSGKTTAGVLLLLAALEYRQRVSTEERPLVPVPVLFTLHDWDPAGTPFEDWLTAQLQATYPLFVGKRGADRARDLISSGGLAVILDGLDEIPQALRPIALRALSDQARLRVVLLTRSAEMVKAATEEHFVDAAALELQPVDAATAADYLSRVQVQPAPHGWQALIDHLRAVPDSSIARALQSPLTLTLLRDTYRGDDDVRQLLDVADRAYDDAAQQDVENYLLDRVIPAAYGPRPGARPSRYRLSSANDALRYIAERMDAAATRDLQWWVIPVWMPMVPRLVVTAFFVWCSFGLVFLLGSERSLGPVLGVSVLVSVVAAAPTAVGGVRPYRLGALRLRRFTGWAATAKFALGNALTWGVVARLLPGNSLESSLKLALVIAVASALLHQFLQPVVDEETALGPRASWRADRTFWLVGGLAGGVFLGLTNALVNDLAGGLAGDVLVPFVGGRVGEVMLGVLGGLVLGATFGVIYSRTWVASLGFLQMSRRHDTPPRLLTFLEDARDRGVLRTVGPVYQFRHARLQDRLAAGQARSHHSDASPLPVLAGEDESR